MMSVMAYIWALTTVAVFMVLTVRYLLGRRQGYGEMMAFGFAFYCALPFAVYGFDLYEGGPGDTLWGRSFEVAYKNSFMVLAIFSFWCGAFVSGGLMPALKFWRGLNSPLSPVVLRGSFVFLFLLWLFFVFQARDGLFSGYGGEYRPDLMGPLATVNLLATMVLLNIRQFSIFDWTKKTYLGLLVVNCAILLSMGGRMYVMVSCICFFMQYINKHNKFVMRLRVLIFLFASIFALAMVGVWRLPVDFDWKIVWITALAEPVLTSISMGSYLDCGDLNFIQFPWNFLGSIANFIPSFFFSNKEDFLPGLDSDGHCLYSPFGATHVLAALLGNFGVIGSMVFLFLFAWFLKSLANVCTRGWWFNYYACGLLPFIFYRDGFLIFNKVLLGSGLLLAVIMVAASRLRWCSLGKRPIVKILYGPPSLEV